MKIALNEKTTACCRESFRQTKLVQEQAECIVPDVLEDVGQIVSAQAQICLKRKDVTDHAVSIGAEAQISVFYVTESRDRVRCMSFSKDLQIGFDAAQIEPNTNAQISLCCMGVQARAVNPRKLAAQLSVRAELCCWAEESFSVPADALEQEEKSLQLRQSQEDCVFTVSVFEKSFTVNEQLPLGAERDAAALSCVRTKLILLEHQPIGSKLLLKGSAELSIACETQEGECPQFIEQSIPFSVLVDMPDEDCTLGRVIFEPTALYVDLGDAINGSRIVDIELHATAQMCFERRETLIFLSDAYSTSCPAVIAERTLPICRSICREQLTANAYERIRVERERGEIISAFSELLSCAVHDGKAELSASVSLLLRSEDGSFGTQQRLISFDTPLPEPEGEISLVRITSLRAEREGEEIAISISAAFDYTQRELVELCCLSSLELDTENAFDSASLPSLTIARKGEGELWDLAKRCHSSVEAIEQTQQKYPMPGDLLLIPRL